MAKYVPYTVGGMKNYGNFQEIYRPEFLPYNRFPLLIDQLIPEPVCSYSAILFAKLLPGRLYRGIISARQVIQAGVVFR